MKPVIAVSAQTAVSDSRHYGEQKLTSLYDLYVNSLKDAGCLPVVLAHGDPADAPALLDRFDALVLPGGGDIDPAHYGENRDADNLYGIRPESDLFEIALVQEAAARKLPVLGICRGLQVINIAMGGTLHQDLPEHPQDLMGRAFAGHYRTSIEPDTRLHGVVDTSELVVNSLHHQGVKDVGDGLTVTASALDGVVEALEPIDPEWDMIAVQWHPECLRTDHSVAIFDWLATAAAARLTRVDVHLVFEADQQTAVKGIAAAS
ncbi:MAG: gamma-glutamyl-gamma-aminobutyrate hydrolase family protein [Acidimicrobiia bacterium]|nr:gamma-glutamyl-gamma-aminobutyrate hydrolase family protein [Acidimicrobiia bacterium]